MECDPSEFPFAEHTMNFRLHVSFYHVNLLLPSFFFIELDI